MQFRSGCLTKSISLQKRIILAEKKLLALNPVSTAIQLRYDLTEILRVAAAVAENWPEVARLTIELSQIRNQQMALDRMQKTIITSTQIMSLENTSQIAIDLQQNALQFGRLWAVFLKTIFVVYPSHFSQVSVRAKTSGIAPNYELKDSYKSDQKVAFNWQLRYFTKNESQGLVTSQNSFEMNCQASPNKSGDQWSIEI